MGCNCGHTDLIRLFMIVVHLFCRKLKPGSKVEEILMCFILEPLSSSIANLFYTAWKLTWAQLFKA